MIVLQPGDLLDGCFLELGEFLLSELEIGEHLDILSLVCSINLICHQL